MDQETCDEATQCNVSKKSPKNPVLYIIIYYPEHNATLLTQDSLHGAPHLVN